MPLEPDLWTRGSNSLHARYEASVAFSLPAYRVGSLPSETQLRRDLLDSVRTYRALVADPGLRLEDFVAVDAPEPATVKVVELPFVPEDVAPRGKGAGGRSKRPGGKAANKIGRQGEELALQFEIDRLTDAGRSDLALAVQPDFKIGSYPGWDITSFELDGAHRFIEVKSTVAARLPAVDFTVHEWDIARRPRTHDHYWLYLFTKDFSNKPEVRVVRDPAMRVAAQELSVEPSAYELTLGRRVPD